MLTMIIIFCLFVASRDTNTVAVLVNSYWSAQTNAAALTSQLIAFIGSPLVFLILLYRYTNNNHKR